MAVQHKSLSGLAAVQSRNYVIVAVLLNHYHLGGNTDCIEVSFYVLSHFLLLLLYFIVGFHAHHVDGDLQYLILIYVLFQ